MPDPHPPTPDPILVSGNQLTFQGKTYRCAHGKNGFAADKKEGDGCTPIGTFPLRECWYRADRLTPPTTQLPLRIIQENDGWCDDPGSAEYNKHFVIPARPNSPSPFRGEGRGEDALTSPSPFRGEGRGGGALLKYAKRLRTHMTEAEKLLWYHLRAHRFSGYGFRRQRPLGGSYIVDFLCPKKKLIVEIDGGQHADSKSDHARDLFLQQEGYRVMRFWNNEVLGNIESVLTVILEALENPSTPSLTLPPEGGGESKHSYENLWRLDHQYDLIIPIGYNDAPPQKGKGSAIFIHIAKPDYSGTEGCIALAREDLLVILPHLSISSTIEIYPT